ncbi:hypothetical protein KFL_015970010, partial [Klebsormidium nitens]
LQKLFSEACSLAQVRQVGSNELKHLLATFVAWEEALRKVKDELKRRTSEEKKWKAAALELAPAGQWWNLAANRKHVEAWEAALKNRKGQFEECLQEMYDSVLEEFNAGADMIKYKCTLSARSIPVFVAQKKLIDKQLEDLQFWIRQMQRDEARYLRQKQTEAAKRKHGVALGEDETPVEKRMRAVREFRGKAGKGQLDIGLGEVLSLLP